MLVLFPTEKASTLIDQKKSLYIGNVALSRLVEFFIFEFSGLPKSIEEVFPEVPVIAKEN